MKEEKNDDKSENPAYKLSCTKKSKILQQPIYLLFRALVHIGSTEHFIYTQLVLWGYKISEYASLIVST